MHKRRWDDYILMRKKRKEYWEENTCGTYTRARRRIAGQWGGVQEHDCRAVGQTSGSLEYRPAVLNTNHNLVLKRQTQIHTNCMKHRQMANEALWINEILSIKWIKGSYEYSSGSHGNLEFTKVIRKILRFNLIKGM